MTNEIVSHTAFIFDNGVRFDEKILGDGMIEQKLVLDFDNGPFFGRFAFDICEITPKELRELADLIDENKGERFIYSFNPESNGGEALLIIFNDYPSKQMEISLNSYGQTASLTTKGFESSSLRRLAQQIELVRAENIRLNAKKAEV